ncbi:MAG: RagB/SusD family nutrient uptake outer membrane protein, partial [Sediminibacterium sp.]
EFGGEGIRKYDLIRWNLLGTALAETKANLANFAAGTAMVAPSYMAPPPAYTLSANLPQSMYFYLNANSFDGQIWANSFYTPAPAVAPLDVSVTPLAPIIAANKVVWYKNANITTTYVNFLGFGFVSGKSELYPLPQASIDANFNLKPQNPGY